MAMAFRFGNAKKLWAGLQSGCCGSSGGAVGLKSDPHAESPGNAKSIIEIVFVLSFLGALCALARSTIFPIKHPPQSLAKIEENGLNCFDEFGLFGSSGQASPDTAALYRAYETGRAIRQLRSKPAMPRTCGPDFSPAVVAAQAALSD